MGPLLPIPPRRVCLSPRGIAGADDRQRTERGLRSSDRSLLTRPPGVGLQEHPCFATTNNIYGSKVPSQAQMTNLYHGANGRFTKSFPNNFKNDSLKCSKTRSRVHSQLDEF